MRISPYLLALVALATGAGLHAQSSTVAMTAPVTDPNPLLTFRGDAEAVYGFRFKQTGAAVDFGVNLTPTQFIGLEDTYFRLTGTTHDAVSGTINSTEKINVFGGAYRYSASLGRFSDSMADWPVRFYLGGGAGIASVKLDTSVPSLGYYTSDKDKSGFGAEGNTGLEWWITRNIAVKAGFRYIYLHHVELYGQTGNIDTGAVEGGVAIRF